MFINFLSRISCSWSEVVTKEYHIALKISCEHLNGNLLENKSVTKFGMFEFLKNIQDKYLSVKKNKRTKKRDLS